MTVITVKKKKKWLLGCYGSSTSRLTNFQNTDNKHNNNGTFFLFSILKYFNKLFKMMTRTKILKLLAKGSPADIGISHHIYLKMWFIFLLFWMSSACSFITHHISKMGPFAKIVNGLKPLTNLQKALSQMRDWVVKTPQILAIKITNGYIPQGNYQPICS